jgi:hypothetical protein
MLLLLFRSRGAVIDGELVVLGEDGKPRGFTTGVV